MKKRYRWHPTIFFRNLLALVMILFFLWTAISYCEILIKNTSIDTRPTYSEWNFWTMWIDE